MESAAAVAAITDHETHQRSAEWRQCEIWWEDWSVNEELPNEEDCVPADMCDTGGWPAANAGVHQRLFAAMLYEGASRFEDASRHFVAASRADPMAVRSAQITLSYDSMCRKVHNKSALTVLAASDDEAVRQLAAAMRKCHAEFDERIMAAVSSSAASSVSPSASSSATSSVGAAAGEPLAKRRRVEGDGSSASNGSSSLQA